MAITDFPNSAICYILVDIPGEGEFQGTGVIIGPHSVLTAAHLVYDADTGATADQVSLYPGFTPDNGTDDPIGALPGLQSIHTIKVNDRNDVISAEATQSDFAVINTSANLSAFGKFALDPNFTSGEVVVTGYPASNNGYLTGTGGVVSQDRGLSAIGTSALALSPGYSGAPIRDDLYRDGLTIPAVAGTVSTNLDGMKLTPAKAKLIRHWMAADRDLYRGGSYAPHGLVPQIPGTASGVAEAAAVPGTGLAAPATAPFAYVPAGEASPVATPAVPAAVPAVETGLGAALLDPGPGAGAVTFTPVGHQPVAALAAPVQVFHPNQGWGTDA